MFTDGRRDCTFCPPTMHNVRDADNWGNMCCHAMTVVINALVLVLCTNPSSGSLRPRSSGANGTVEMNDYVKITALFCNHSLLQFNLL